MDFQPAKTQISSQLFCAPSFYRGFFHVFSLFPVVVCCFVWKSAINFRIRYSSFLVEPDIELNDE